MNHALLVQIDQGDYFFEKLHYHPEFQITAIRKGEGIFYAGNNMISFSPNDVFLIGSNVPHLFKNSKVYYSSESPGIESISLFFDYYSFGEKFFDINELVDLKNLLQEANRVLKINHPIKNNLYNTIINTAGQSKDELVIAFLQILSLMKNSEKQFINSNQYQLMMGEDEGGRLNEVINFTFKHYKEDITLEQVINVAHLSRSQFSKFFKLHTGKTYIQFLNEIRIENACSLLSNTSNTIEQICYEIGFKNVSNFVRQFKKIKNQTPSKYRKSWQVGL
jgi:AraC-like DNA-binding protein